MFQFPGCASLPYVFRQWYLDFTRDALPHSEIPGSKLARQLPEAYRNPLRPSSLIWVKASTICPYEFTQLNNLKKWDSSKTYIQPGLLTALSQCYPDANRDNGQQLAIINFFATAPKGTRQNANYINSCQLPIFFASNLRHERKYIGRLPLASPETVTGWQDSIVKVPSAEMPINKDYLPTSPHNKFSEKTKTASEWAA